MTDIQAIEREIERKNSYLQELYNDLPLHNGELLYSEEYLTLLDEIEALETNLYNLMRFESSANSSLSFV